MFFLIMAYILIKITEYTSMACRRVSEPQHGWHFGMVNSLLSGTKENIPGLSQLDASSIIFSSTASHNISKCLQTLPNIPCWARLPPVENHWFQIKVKVYKCL